MKTVKKYKSTKKSKKYNKSKTNKVRGGEPDDNSGIELSQINPPVKVEEPVAPIVVEEEPVAPIIEEEPVAPIIEEDPVAPIVVEEEPVAPIIEEEPVAPIVVEEEPVAPIVVEEEPVAPIIATTNVNEVSVNIDKSSFNKLAVNLNMNILINVSAYINVLNKIIEFETNGETKIQIQELIETLTQQQTVFGTTFKKIQNVLKIENPQTAEDIKSNNSKFSDVFFGAQTAATLATFVTVASLLGGSKNKTKHRNIKGKKTTRRIKKVTK
jgi:hypothetical protein